jgi:hypothetical protein
MLMGAPRRCRLVSAPGAARWRRQNQAFWGGMMNTLKRLVRNDFLRYALFAAFLAASCVLAYPIGRMLGRQLYLLTH